MKTWNFFEVRHSIEDNIPVQMSRRQLANLSGQSLSNFTAYFCKGTGLPPKQESPCAAFTVQSSFWYQRMSRLNKFLKTSAFHVRICFTEYSKNTCWMRRQFTMEMTDPGKSDSADYFPWISANANFPSR